MQLNAQHARRTYQSINYEYHILLITKAQRRLCLCNHFYYIRV